MKKVLVIGGSKGIGLELVNYFNADFVSRTNGYDITNLDDIKRIASISINYDVVINHAYAGGLSQLNVLELIVEEWIKQNKKGTIINTSSISTYRPYFKDNLKWVNYTSTKAAVDSFCFLISKKCQENKYAFRITNIKPGTLDTLSSRNKPGYTSGIAGIEYCKIVEFVINMPDYISIPEIAVEAKG